MYGWLKRMFSSPVAPASMSDAVPEDDIPTRAQSPKRSACDESGVSWMQRSVADYEFTSWLFEAENHPDLFTNRTEDAILAELDGITKSPQSGAHLVRRMPGVIPQLLQSLRSPDFSGADLSRKIWHDVVLVAEVLRLANSASYSPGAPITSIDHAILILGQDGLRQLVTSVAFKPIIDLKSGHLTRRVAPRLWDQAERCAVASRLLVQDRDVDPLEAFLAGLVHNVGLTVALRVVDRMSDGKERIGSPTFCNALAAYGRALSFNIGREWRFPEAVTVAVREADAGDHVGDLSPLGKVLQIGDYLSKLDTLRRQGRIAADDARLTQGLTEEERACISQIALLEERDWGPLVSR